MKKIITLEVGNTSWWKNKKYRKEAAVEIKNLRKNKFRLKLLKKYHLNSANTVIYGDYEIS